MYMEKRKSIKRSTTKVYLRNSRLQNKTDKDINKLIQINKNVLEEDDEFEGYTISKDLIIEAWCRFRPSKTISDEEEYNNKKMKVASMEDILGRKFINRLMLGFKMRYFK